MSNFEYRTLKRDGKCVCCGKKLLPSDHFITQPKVFVIQSKISQVYQMSICTNCVIQMNTALTTNIDEAQ